MRTEFEPQDIEAIAKRVIELLTPAITRSSKGSVNDTIFDVQGLAGYLHVDASWIYKQVQYGSLPHIKLGKYLRFSKVAIDKYLERSTVQATSPVKQTK